MMESFTTVEKIVWITLLFMTVIGLPLYAITGLLGLFGVVSLEVVTSILTIATIIILCVVSSLLVLTICHLVNEYLVKEDKDNDSIEDKYKDA